MKPFEVLQFACLFKVFMLKFSSAFDASYLGCYTDLGGSPDLNGHTELLPATNSPQACKALCNQRGFLYAGVQNGEQCYCGDSYGKHGRVVDEKCNQACSGDATKSCGAERKQAVYKTGLPQYSPWKEVVFDNTPAETFVHFDVGYAANAARLWAVTDHADKTYGAAYYVKDGGWVSDSGDVAKVVVGSAGIFAAQGSNIFFRSGVTAELPEGTVWEFAEGRLDLFDSGVFNLYGISPVKQMFYRDDAGFQHFADETLDPAFFSAGKYAMWTTTEPSIKYRTGIEDSDKKGGDSSGFFPNDGKVLVESTDHGQVFSLDRNGTVYYRDGVNKTSPTGSRWVPIRASRKFVRVAAESLAIWGLDDGGKIWKAELQVNDSSYIGCYRDHGMNKDLDGYHVSFVDMTVAKCRHLCAVRNFVYAAVQFWSNCYCGDTYGKHGKYPEEDCSLECVGNFNERCGGWSRNSIYKSGSVRIEEISPDQKAAEHENVELFCRTQSILSPVYVAWQANGVLLQNKTENTNLIVTPSRLGVSTYQCMVNYAGLSDSKNVTIHVHDSIVPCGNHQSINDPTRSTENCGVVETIKDVDPGVWYQFFGSGGTQVPTTCVKENKCGGKASGWLDGGHPKQEDGVVARTMCYSYDGDCCYFSVTVNVQQCYGYYIYKFPEIPDYFPGRICTEKEADGPSSKASTRIFSSSGRTKDRALVGHKIETFQAPNSASCNVYCLVKVHCESFNYSQTSKECELNDAKAAKDFSNLATRPGFSYYHPVGTAMKTARQN